MPGNDRRIGWGASVRRYSVASALVVGGTVGVGWVMLGPEGRNGLLVAGGLALAAQFAIFAVVAAQRPGSGRYLAAWGGSTLFRFAVVGGAAWWAASAGNVDLLVTLLVLVMLLFVLLLLEPWALRERQNRGMNG